jgi:ribosomal protein L37AE/L43A
MNEYKKTWQQELNEKRQSDGWYGCSVNDGWQNIVLEADAMLEYIDPDYKISQVKEKFGSLRYIFETDKYGLERKIMDAIAEYAERKSNNTCEDCGEYGIIRGDIGWMLTLCDKCHSQHNPDPAYKVYTDAYFNNLASPEFTKEMVDTLDKETKLIQKVLGTE